MSYRSERITPSPKHANAWANADDAVIIAAAKSRRAWVDLCTDLPHRSPLAIRDRVRVLAGARQITVAQRDALTAGVPARRRAGPREDPEPAEPVQISVRPADPVRVARYWLRLGVAAEVVAAELRRQCPAPHDWPAEEVEAVCSAARRAMVGR